MTRDTLIELIIENAVESMDLDDLIQAYADSYRCNLELEDNEELLYIANSYSISDDDDTAIILED